NSDIPKTMIQIPKPVTAHNSFLPALRCKGKRVEITMVREAPMAGAALRMPKPSEPTCKISWAYMGKRATAPPKRTATISKVNTPKMALLLNTNRSPSPRLWKTGSPNLGFIMGFLRIWNRKARAKREKKKIRHMDQCTPIQLMEKPARAGPSTTANCQVELLQVAALG